MVATRLLESVAKREMRLALRAPALNVGLKAVSSLSISAAVLIMQVGHSWEHCGPYVPRAHAVRVAGGGKRIDGKTRERRKIVLVSLTVSTEKNQVANENRMMSG